MPNRMTKAVIADFGISQLSGQQNPRNERKGDRVGKPMMAPIDFAAPEAQKGRGCLKSDVYSISIILWRLVYRKRAFSRRNDEKLDEMRLRERPQSNDLIQKLEEILVNCWAHELENRWDSRRLFDRLRIILEEIFPERKNIHQSSSSSSTLSSMIDPNDRFALDPPVCTPFTNIDTIPYGTLKSHKWSRSRFEISMNEGGYTKGCPFNPYHSNSYFNPRFGDDHLRDRIQVKENTYGIRGEISSSDPSSSISNQSSSTTSTYSSNEISSSVNETTITLQDSSSRGNTTTTDETSTEEEEETEDEDEEEEMSEDETQSSTHHHHHPIENIQLINLENEDFFMRVFDLMRPKTLENPIVEFAEQEVNLGKKQKQNIVAIGNVRGVYVLKVTGLNESKEKHNLHKTLIFKPDRNRAIRLHMIRWNQRGKLLAALYQIDEHYQLMTARIDLREEGFHFELFELSLKGENRVYPIDLEWSPNNTQLIALCFNNSIHIFNEELHKLNRVGHPVASPIQENGIKIYLRKGAVACWEASVGRPMICGWDLEGIHFTFIISGIQFKWTKDHTITPSPLENIPPNYSKCHRLIGDLPERKVFIVGETEFGFEVWRFTKDKLSLRYRHSVNPQSFRINHKGWGMNFSISYDPVKDIRYVFKSTKSEILGGDVSIAVNVPIGDGLSELHVWVGKREIPKIVLEGDRSKICCLRFKPTPHYLAALTDKFLFIYQIDQKAISLIYRYDMSEISPYSSEINWNHDGQKMILHRKSPTTPSLIGVTLLIRTRFT